MRELRPAARWMTASFAATGIDDPPRHRALAMNIHRALAAEAAPHRRAQPHGQPHGQLDRTKADIAARTPSYAGCSACHVRQIRAAFREARRWCPLAVTLVATGAVAFPAVTGGAANG